MIKIFTKKQNKFSNIPILKVFPFSRVTRTLPLLNPFYLPRSGILSPSNFFSFSSYCYLFIYRYTYVLRPSIYIEEYI